MFTAMTLLILGFPAVLFLGISLTAFKSRKPGAGFMFLVGAGILIALLVWKLNNPDWSLLNRGQRQDNTTTEERVTE